MNTILYTCEVNSKYVLILCLRANIKKNITTLVVFFRYPKTFDTFSFERVFSYYFYDKPIVFAVLFLSIN